MHLIVDTGPSESNFTQMATIKSTGLRTRSPQPDATVVLWADAAAIQRKRGRSFERPGTCPSPGDDLSPSRSFVTQLSPP